MPTAKSLLRVKTKLKHMLINAEMEGLSQTVIYKKCRTYNKKTNPDGINTEHLEDILSSWKHKGYVQCFVVRFGYAKKPTRIWRALAGIKFMR